MVNGISIYIYYKACFCSINIDNETFNMADLTSSILTSIADAILV